MDIKNREIEDKLNVYYLQNIFDFIRFGPKNLDVNDIVDSLVECWNQPKKLEEMKMLLLHFHSRYKKSFRVKKYGRERRFWLKFKLNQRKGRRKGYRYRSIRLMKRMLETGREEEAIEWAKEQLESFKERQPRTYYRHKKDLKEMGINWE